jgi:hypothetical protein
MITPLGGKIGPALRVYQLGELSLIQRHPLLLVAYLE